MPAKAFPATCRNLVRMGKSWALGGVVGAAVVAVVAGSSPTSAATGPAVARLTDRQVSDVRLGPADSVGSREVVQLKVYGQNGRTLIGNEVLVCTTVAKTLRSCTGSYVLPRGSIQTAGLVRSRLLFTQAIVGGTGLFDNARGTVTVTATSVTPRRDLVLMRLTG